MVERGTRSVTVTVAVDASPPAAATCAAYCTCSCAARIRRSGRGRIARGCDEHLELLSEHVDVSNDLSQGPPSLSADVVLRPERAYSWVYPSTGAKHIQIGTRFSVTTYRQVGPAGRWLAYAGHFAHPGYFEQRLLVADPWTWMEPADLVMVACGLRVG